MKIGFIGTGVMGAAMAGHLQAAGYALYVYNRTQSKADALVTGGATWCDDVKTVAQQADVIFTIIGMPSDVEAVYLGEDGLIANAKQGAILIDMTTSSPSLAKRIAEAGEKAGVSCVDAPVTGGDIGAKNGTLTIFVGGEEKIFKTLLPMFDVFGQSIFYLGTAGSGQHGKIANQIAISGAVIGMAESLAYANGANIDLRTMQEAISTGSGASWQMSNMAPRATSDDFAPGFYIKHFVKDMNIGLEEALISGVDLPALKLVRDQYVKMIAAGDEDLGTQAIVKLYSSR